MSHGLRAHQRGAAQTPPITAFEESANIVMKCFSSAFALCLILSLYAVLCAVTCLVVAIVLAPFMRVLLVTAYRQAKGLSTL